MGPPRSTSQSPRPGRSPPTSMARLPWQTMPDMTATSTPQQALATDLISVHSGPRFQLSRAPDSPPGLVTTPTSTLPPPAFRIPSEGLTRALLQSVVALETLPQGDFGSTSTFGRAGSALGIHRLLAHPGRDGPGELAAQVVRGDVMNSEQLQFVTSTSSAPVNLAARIHDSRVARQGFQVLLWDIWYLISCPDQWILWKSFPWQMTVLGVATFLTVLNLLLLLSNLGWWDFESRGGIRLVGVSAATLACILCLKLRLVSHLWGLEESIEREDFPTPIPLLLPVSKKEIESTSKAPLTSALPAGLFTRNHSPFVRTPEKPHSLPNPTSSTPSGEASHASQTIVTNNSKGRHVIVHPVEATGAPPLPFPSPSSSGPARSEFLFLSTEPSLRGWVSEPKGDPDGYGGYSDLYKSRIWFHEPSDLHSIDVAVKVLRKVFCNQLSDAESHLRILARFQQEAITWSGLAHPNIVPLIGYTLAPSPRFISPWYRQGSLRQYLTKNTGVHKLKLLHGIAKALDYLHSRVPQIAHGDIKPENVLIDDQNEPSLADFGLATILGEEHMYTVSQQHAGTWKWMAPEQILGGSRSCESDTYSFGSLAFWVMTSEMPFASLRDNEIIFAVNDCTKPVSPVQDWNKYPNLESSLKDIISDCWSPVPEERPSMSLVEERLAALVELNDGCVATVPREASS